MKNYIIQIKHSEKDIVKKYTNCYISAWDIAEEFSQAGYVNVTIYDNIKKTIVAEDWQGKWEMPLKHRKKLLKKRYPNEDYYYDYYNLKGYDLSKVKI